MAGGWCFLEGPAGGEKRCRQRWFGPPGAAFFHVWAGQAGNYRTALDTAAASCRVLAGKKSPFTSTVEIAIILSAKWGACQKEAPEQAPVKGAGAQNGIEILPHRCSDAAAEKGSPVQDRRSLTSTVSADEGVIDPLARKG